MTNSLRYTIILMTYSHDTVTHSAEHTNLN